MRLARVLGWHYQRGCTRFGSLCPAGVQDALSNASPPAVTAQSLGFLLGKHHRHGLQTLTIKHQIQQ